MKSHKKITFFASLAVFLIISALSFVLAVSLFPPYSGFVDVTVNANNAVGFMRFPVCASALAFVLASYQYGFKLKRMILPIILVCASYIFGYEAFDYLDMTVSAYPVSTMLLAFVPWLFAELIKGFSKNKSTRLKRIAYFLAVSVLTLVLVYFSVIDIYIGAMLTSFLLLFVLPVIPILTSLCILFADRRFEHITRPIFVIIKLSAPAFFIFRSFDVFSALSVSSYSFGIFAIFAIFALVYEIIYIIKTEREKKSMSNNVISGLGFHHIGLKVKDFERSYDFYVNGLGMKPYAAWGEGDKRIQMLDIGNGDILELFAGGNEELDRENVWQHFAMTVEDVEKAFETALKAGATPHVLPKVVDLDSTPEKMSINVAFVKGPDNEQLEFFKVVKE